MSKIKKAIFLFLFLSPLWGAGVLFSQTYPVQVNVYALPPYSNQLSDYYTTSREKLVVSLLNRDQNRPDLDVELKMTISAASGLKIQNKAGVFYPTITLTEGVLTRLTQDDLAPYLQNITQQGYMNQGKLPEGMVEFTFQAIEKYTKKPLSQPATARVWLAAQKPPLLNLPTNGEFIAFREPLNIRFQWTPQHKNISQVEYEFELRELPNNGAAPQSAFLYSPVIYSEQLRFTTLQYTPLLPPLDPDKTYGWRIRAIAKDGIDEINLFENGGFSEVWFFKTQTNCEPPAGCTATVKDRDISLNWTAGAGNTEYIIQYRNKTVANAQWTSINAAAANTVLKSLPRNETYEYRIGGVCGVGSQPVFSPIGEASIGARDLSNCGIAPEVDLSNQELLPELKVGDVVTVGGDFPMTITKVTGGSYGTFSGEGWIPINWVFEMKLAMEFDALTINTDYRQIGGTAHAKYDKNNSQIADLDALTDGGTVENSRKGVIMPSLNLDFTIPENPVFGYDSVSGSMIVYTTDGQVVGKAETPKNNGKTVFPVIVKDKDGNIYKIEETEDSQGGSGTDTPAGSTEKLKATYLSKQGAPVPNLDTKNIDASVAVVTFNKGAGKFAFDEWKEYYEKVSIINSKNVYDHLSNPKSSTNRYDVPWKLLPAGENDQIQAKIEVFTKDTAFHAEKVVFSTPQGTVYKSEYNSKDKIYTLTLPSGSDNDVQEIYALNRRSSENYQTLGKLNVITYKKQTPKVKVVFVKKHEIDKDKLKTELDRIYHPYGVDWQVETDEFQYSVDSAFFDKNSTLLSTYNSRMLALQSAYKKEKGVDKNVCYIFVLYYSGVDNNRNTAGFMPRGGQFGYIFLSNIDKGEEYNVVAHELGHGLWKLKHTFDKDYGTTAEGTQGHTDNLMDYSKNADHLAKWQWDIMRSPAIFDGVLDKDEEGMKTNKTYYLTIDGVNVLKFDMKVIENEFNQTKLLSNEALKNYNYKTIQLYVMASDKLDYIISTKLINGDKDKGNVSELFFDSEKTLREQKITYSLAFKENQVTHLYYSGGMEGTFPSYKIEIIRVKPNIAYKNGDREDYIIKEISKEPFIKNDIEILGNKIFLRPVFLTLAEEYEGVTNITSLFERNKDCAYLIDSIIYDTKGYDTDKKLDWIEYTVNENNSIYEIVAAGKKTTGIIKPLKFSPFVTVVRSTGNEENGYYIEDYYSTSVPYRYTSLRETNNTMKTGEFNVLGTPYRIPIVHYKNPTTVKLMLTDANVNSKNTNPIQYKIGEKNVILNQEFSIQTEANGKILDIKDMEGNIRGHIEFRQINLSQLSPILNIVTINTAEMGSGYSFPTVLNDLNAIYNTMNVNWQQGKHIIINGLDDKGLNNIKSDNKVYDNIIMALTSHFDYKENQYYLIISPKLDGFGGFTNSLNENCAIVQKTYDKRHTPHELGHCNGLDEFAVNIGVVAASSRNDSEGNLYQYRSTNVMGYSNWQHSPVLPLKDFFSWQIPLIRQNINNRINIK